MKQAFTIPGEPRGKGRPRFTRIGNGVRTYTDKETASYENLVRLAYRQQCEGPPPACRSLAIRIAAHFGVPKSYPKRTHEAVARGEALPHAKKPDLDNIVKAVIDGLNGVAFQDDAQISGISARKSYGLTPGVTVEITYHTEA